MVDERADVYAIGALLQFLLTGESLSPEEGSALYPVATVILVLVTLFGALPVYAYVAKYSPHGQGSISMLERLVSGWTGKVESRIRF